MSDKTSRPWLWMLVAALAAANALLIVQNIQLRREVGRPQPRRLKAGEPL